MQQDKQAHVRFLATEYATTEETSALPDSIKQTQELKQSTSSCISSSSSSTSSSAPSECDSTPLSSPPLSTSFVTSGTSSNSSRILPRQSSKSKVLLLHPSVVYPSNARQLEDVRYVTVLYNPASGNKRGEKVMVKTVAKFRSHGLDVKTIQLQYRGHATDICKSRIDFEDMDVLCVIGGDGTFHEVVNGLMQHPLAKIAPQCLPALSVIPAGTGNSMVRELQGISSVRVSTDEVLFGTTIAIDILKVTILSLQTDSSVATVPEKKQNENDSQKNHQQNHHHHHHKNNNENVETPDEAFENEKQHLEKIVGGKRFVTKEVIYGFNSIHWGLASRVLERAEKMRWMGHGIRYTTASLMELMQGTSTHARVVLEDANGAVTEYEKDTFCLLIANNIGTAGKGMTMAPKAKINDGLIDLLLIRSHKPWHLMKIFERMYSGTHVDLPYVEYKQVRKFSIFPYKKANELEVQSSPQFAEELVDIDGELKGCTPFECEIIPQALQLII